MTREGLLAVSSSAETDKAVERGDNLTGSVQVYLHLSSIGKCKSPCEMLSSLLEMYKLLRLWLSDLLVFFCNFFFFWIASKFNYERGEKNTSCKHKLYGPLWQNNFRITFWEVFYTGILRLMDSKLILLGKKSKYMIDSNCQILSGTIKGDYIKDITFGGVGEVKAVRGYGPLYYGESPIIDVKNP